MVERIVNTFIDVLPRPLTEAVFVLGDFPAEVNEALAAICARHGIKASFAFQETALGTGHAVHCAAEYLDGEVITVFADTLFGMDVKPSFDDVDVLAFIKHIDDPSRFGVAVREGDRVVALVEKPQTLVSTEALIGIYYVRDGREIRDAIQRLIDEDITGHGNEYQLTDAFDLLIKKGLVFKTTGVSEWLDCGTLDAFAETSFHLLQREASVRGEVTNSAIAEPVFVAEGVSVRDSSIGPNVIIEAGASVTGSTLRDTIVFPNARVTSSVLSGSIVGHDAVVSNFDGKLNIGDHSSIG